MTVHRAHLIPRRHESYAAAGIILGVASHYIGSIALHAHLPSMEVIMETILNGLRAVIASARERLHHAGETTAAAARKLDQDLVRIYSRTMSDRLHM
jgi:hypothetical protein